MMRRFAVVLALVLMVGLMAGTGPVVSAPATFVVTSTSDDIDAGGCEEAPGGDCTLREALVAAASNAGVDTIAFDISYLDPNYNSSTGVWTILLGPGTPLNPTSGEIVDGSTQTLNAGDPNPYGPEIQISGEYLSSGQSCWSIGTTSGGTIRGLAINYCPGYAIVIQGDNNTLAGNYIGTDATGTIDVGAGITGILIDNGAKNNTIGGPSQADRNLISGNNGGGVRLAGAATTGNVVEGNYIGTDRTGASALPNGSYGVRIDNGAHDNRVGPGNLIAYHTLYGVVASGSETAGNTITQNSIHSNAGWGISLLADANNNMQWPVLSSANCVTVTGQGSPTDGVVEVFSDEDGQGRLYQEGTVSWDGENFTFSSTCGRLRGPKITATIRDPGTGDTSAFSLAPVNLVCQDTFVPLVTKNF